MRYLLGGLISSSRGLHIVSSKLFGAASSSLLVAAESGKGLAV
ncbi:MAG: hypothetical protein QXG81_01270 [Ignisphaera sp.]